MLIIQQESKLYIKKLIQNILNYWKNLNKKLNLPILIAGGKTIENYKSEAKVIQEYFNEEDNQQIYIEEQSLNTNETAKNLIKILKNHFHSNLDLRRDICPFRPNDYQ